MPFAQFEADAAAGDLPDFSYIEPCLILGHGDYHPAAARALGHGIVIPGLDPPSSILGGEAFLARIYKRLQGDAVPAGSNVWNTTLLIGWDEPGGTFDQVPPGPVPPPDPSAPEGQLGFTFDRSGYRVPAMVVSPWVAEGRCSTRSTGTFPDRYAAGAVGPGRPAHRPRRRRPNVTHTLTLDTRETQARGPCRTRARCPVHPGRVRPRPDHNRHRHNRLQRDTGIRQQHNIQIEGLPDNPNAEIPAEQALHIIHNFLAIQFPLLHPAAPGPGTAT